MRAFLSQEGVTGGAVGTLTIGGFEAARADFGVQSEESSTRGVVTAILANGLVYQVMGITSADRWSTGAATLRAIATSFAPLTDRTDLAVQPLRLQVRTLDRGMTLGVFNQRYPSQISLERLALLNRVGVADPLPAGTLIKRVVGGPLPVVTP